MYVFGTGVRWFPDCLFVDSFGHGNTNKNAKSKEMCLGIVPHTCNLSSWEAEASGLQVVFV